MPEFCEIKIRGHLGQYWSEWFSGLKVTSLEEDVCLLSGVLPDQAALHGLLERIRDLNLALVSVTSRSAEEASNADSPAGSTESAMVGSDGAVDSPCSQPTETDPPQENARRLSNGQESADL